MPGKDPLFGFRAGRLIDGHRGMSTDVMWTVMGSLAIHLQLPSELTRRVEKPQNSYTGTVETARPLH